MFAERLSLSLGEATMIDCATKCSNASVYLAIQTEIIGSDKAVVDILKSKNEYSFTIFPVKERNRKAILVSVWFNSTKRSPSIISAPFSSKLRSLLFLL